VYISSVFKQSKEGVKHLVRYLAEEDLDDIEAGNKYAG
jgi:hypothetical protein